jgi:hypothetical protein
MKPVKTSTKDLSKGERRNWTPLSDVRAVPLTKSTTKGKQITQDNKAAKSNLFVP